mmetsp:Transcript_6738/g.10828  ORF Transcript_6738/g.10828 Transcript_6738/m.10828 type:complete len:111 (+) Transcript_6738:313-645(+)
MLAVYRLVFKKALNTFRVYRPVFLFLETFDLSSEDLLVENVWFSSRLGQRSKVEVDQLLVDLSLAQERRQLLFKHEKDSLILSSGALQLRHLPKRQQTTHALPFAEEGKT